METAAWVRVALAYRLCQALKCRAKPSVLLAGKLFQLLAIWGPQPGTLSACWRAVDGIYLFIVYFPIHDCFPDQFFAFVLFQHSTSLVTPSAVELRILCSQGTFWKVCLMMTSSCTRKENKQLFPVLSVPFTAVPSPLVLHLHCIFFQFEGSQRIGCALFGSCAKPLIVFVMSLHPFRDEGSWAEHSNQGWGIMTVFGFVPYFFPNNS